MKLSLSFLVLVAVIQLCTSNILSKREILSSDATAVQNGSDVIMAKSGPLEVILNNANELIFEVCSSKCTAGFLVCYETDSSDLKFLNDTCDTKCGFYVTTKDDLISFNKPFSQSHAGYLKSDQCYQATMSGWTFLMLLEEEVDSLITCAPKVENGIVKLNIINATSDCVVSIKNAKIKPEEIIATSEPNSPPNNPPSDPSSAATKIIGNFGWIFVLISFCILHQ
uniref:Uncharacterized protein n=1 Tax=Panagrolaimus davidi TaxID=227884 RepID=A0A914PR21_9BILA